MRKHFLVALFIAFLLILDFLLMFPNALGMSTKRAEPSPTPVITQPDTSGDSITFICSNCNEKEAAMVPKMQKLLNEVKRTKCFSDRFTLSKYRSKLVQTNGISREDVVKKINSEQIKNIPLIFYTPTFFQSKNVIGYTYPGEPEIYLNRNFRNSKNWGICSEVSNALHESTHKMGFNHDFKATAQRPFSVPYTANFAVEECCDDVKGAIE